MNETFEIDLSAAGRRIHWLYPWLLLVGTLCLLLYLFADRPLAAQCATLPGEFKWWAGLVGSLGNSAFSLVPGIPAFLWLRRAAGRAGVLEQIERLRRQQQRISFLLTTVIASGLTTDLLKVLCGRPRPKVFFGQHLYSFSFMEFSVKMWSFPSGHATTIFATMTACYLLFPRYRLAWFSLAALVAICRVLVGAHFPSDVVVGAFIGTTTAVLVKDYFQARRLLEFP